MTDKIKTAIQAEAEKRYQLAATDFIAEVWANSCTESEQAAFFLGATFGMEMDRWVRVEEGLPDKNGFDEEFSDKVLCTIKLYARTTTAIGFYDYKRGRWFVFGYDGDEKTVTHYQPLPSPHRSNHRTKN